MDTLIVNLTAHKATSAQRDAGVVDAFETDFDDIPMMSTMERLHAVLRLPDTYTAEDLSQRISILVGLAYDIRHQNMRRMAGELPAILSTAPHRVIIDAESVLVAQLQTTLLHSGWSVGFIRSGADIHWVEPLPDWVRWGSQHIPYGLCRIDTDNTSWLGRLSRTMKDDTLNLPVGESAYRVPEGWIVTDSVRWTVTFMNSRGAALACYWTDDISRVNEYLYREYEA